MVAETTVAALHSDLDIVHARSMARSIARSLGFGTVDQARIATAVSEIARMILTEQGEGQMYIRPLEQSGQKGIEITFQQQAPTHGHASVASSDNAGLAAVRRLVDDCEIQQSRAMGTSILCRKWCRPAHLHAG
jgi:serine/threonine-protein kinase RsbT